ncbi:hypothetical protein RRG08_045902 [Elysia crispata]|uniref:Uncharacterized protein n=1 Tax=Elysia crispata TaxID=231223 RepID=A0AAE1E4B1_9GAST|nr:hypothetical protein RRG08_045902 [Elysia crispata]
MGNNLEGKVKKEKNNEVIIKETGRGDVNKKNEEMLRNEEDVMMIKEGEDPDVYEGSIDWFVLEESIRGGPGHSGGR